MLAAKNQVVKYNADMDTYLACIKSEYDAKVAGLTRTRPSEEKAEMRRCRVQKQNAASRK